VDWLGLGKDNMVGIYLIIGAFAGTMAGLFGIGGGVVIIPALAAIFVGHTEIPAANIMQMAVGTSLATVIVTAASSMYAHNKRMAVIWPQVAIMVPWLLLGSVIGAALAYFLPSGFLRIFFSVFLFATGIRMMMDQANESQTALSDRAVKMGSGIIGVLCSILGVGGGTMLVPFLLHCNLDMRQATGTSVACGMAVSIVATACFMLTGILAGVHLPMSTGYIYWPAFVGIAVSSVLFAPFGAALAHKLPRNLLKKIFAIFLLIMAVDMMFS
jgi:uncharacterized membrane protein YfcA